MHEALHGHADDKIKTTAAVAGGFGGLVVDPDAPSLLRPQWGEPLRFGSTGQVPLPRCG